MSEGAMLAPRVRPSRRRLILHMLMMDSLSLYGRSLYARSRPTALPLRVNQTSAHCSTFRRRLSKISAFDREQIRGVLPARSLHCQSTGSAWGVSNNEGLPSATDASTLIDIGGG